MIIISDDLVLSSTGDEETNSNSPLIGWDNLVTIDNITASSEDVDYPAVNLANPITSPIARWQATTTAMQTITFAINSIEDVDYVGIARHNLGTNQNSVIIEGSTDGGTASGWFELVQEVLLPNDAPAIFRFTPQSLTHVRIVIGAGASGSDPAEIAVAYVGKLLPLQRRIYVGHTPINYGRSSKVVSGKSEAGDFLGRVIISEQTETSVELKNLTPSWYRSKLDPFIQASKDTPFFFAWRPGDYPNEVGFAWMTNDPQPKNQLPNGMMNIDLQMTGIAP